MRKLTRALVCLSLYFLFVACADTNSQKEVSANEPDVVLKQHRLMLRPAPTEPTTMVVDEVAGRGKLKNFFKQESLRASASGSFGPEGIGFLKKLLPKKEHELLYVLDLRQEPHALINDRAVTWYAPNNWTNSNSNREEALHREKRILSEIGVGDLLGNLKVISRESFPSLIRASGFSYDRISVVQHVRPTDLEVDYFIELCRRLPAKAWIHFVDYEGKERSAQFLLMYDILMNATSENFEDLVNKYRQLFAKPELFTVSEESSPFHKFEKENLEFLEKFYVYARQNPQGAGKLWGEYILIH